MCRCGYSPNILPKAGPSERAVVISKTAEHFVYASFALTAGIVVAGLAGGAYMIYKKCRNQGGYGEIR